MRSDYFSALAAHDSILQTLQYVLLFIILLATSSGTRSESTTTIYVDGTDASTGARLNDTILGDTIPTAKWQRLCYVAIRTYSDHRVAWLEDCLTNPPAVTNIDMNHLEARRLYFYAALTDQDSRQPWTTDDVELIISSKTIPTKTFYLTTDQHASIHLETNAQQLHLSASATRDGIVGRSMGQDLAGEDVITLQFDCHPSLPQVSSPKKHYQWPSFGCLGLVDRLGIGLQ